MNHDKLKLLKETRNYLMNQNDVIKKERIIDTFPAQHLKEPNNQDSSDSLSEYSLRRNCGLGLIKQRKNRHNIKI